MEDKLSIKVAIANRQYPLRISRAEEEAIRKSAKLINERIKEYEQSYAVTDPQDLLAMCALQFANEASSAKSKKADMNEEQQNKAIEIEQMLDEYLDSI
jgi:cell division protein ZapA